MKNVAVILAGGSGNRLGGTLPKQLLKVAGKKVIEHTLDVFQAHLMIDEIVVVSHPGYIRDMEEILIKGGYTKLKKVLSGGKERYHSSLSAIYAYTEEVNFIFHDAVRPLVNERIITDCINALKIYNAVDVAIPTTDTIIQVNSKNEIIKIPLRSVLRNGQTPQAFKSSIIKKAYEIALKDPDFKTTDDCGVILKYLPEELIYVVKGELFNMKLTYKEDLFLLDKLFQLRSINGSLFSIPSRNFDELRQKVIVVFGGSYGIGKEIVNICRDAGAQIYSYSRSSGIDVSDYNAVRNVLAEVFRDKGRIDYVVNTAGILNKQPLIHMDYEEILRSIRVNYWGAVIVAKESFKYLKMSNGTLLLYTSSSYTRGRSLYSLYSSSKAAIVNLVQALSEEWFDAGVRINCINPERTKTPMRVKNFGVEPDESLLKARDVGMISVNILLSDMTGEIIDVKNNMMDMSADVDGIQ
ncbi:SDR family NAD(P)-dependent oxidoreductase [Bacteroides hominis]|uniref:SDR family NAD(P)-dependent oxidoreductase n=1 Tax=Bacteroides hominis TaxID=2763023 RepID=UPI003D6C4C7E